MSPVRHGIRSSDSPIGTITTSATLLSAAMSGTTTGYHLFERSLKAFAQGRRSSTVGAGVGLAWLATGADPRARLVSVERKPARAAAAAVVFHTTPQVLVVSGDWLDPRAHGPFDLLVLDGGGHRKGGAEPLDPAEWLNLA